MKKKTLVVLLIIPFIIGLLSFVSVMVLNNTVAADIVDILWNYKENEGFKISDKPYELKAEAVIDEDLLLAPHSNEFVWKIRNIDNSKAEYATITQEGNKFYLNALKKGIVQVTCLNVRGTKSKSFNAHIYEDEEILVNRKQQASGRNIDPTYYVGQYDLVYNNLEMDGASRKPASFEIKPTLLGCNSEIFVEPQTPNVTIKNNLVSIIGTGDASIKLSTHEEPVVTTYFDFNIIENGYNIYNYNDLLMATNFSSEPKNVVMQVNLESLKNTYKFEKVGEKEVIYLQEKLPNKENTELFGNFDFKSQTFNFENEYKLVDSTYNTKFIEQYNKEKGTNASTKIIAGIEAKGSIYGNGYSINGNGLTYPNHGKADANTGKFVPSKGEDYFFGPLAYVTIGSLEELPVVKAYGQDNALIYLHGDNLTINDIQISNCDLINNMYSLMYTGSVIDVDGHNNTIKNSILSNGRTIVRAFGSDGLTVENSILQNAAEFIMKVGSNKINDYDFNKTVKANYKGIEYSGNFKDFYNISNENSPYNKILNDILATPAITDNKQTDEIMKSLKQVQDGLANLNGIVDGEKINYSDTINLKSTYFYNSGIFSLAFESMFNGPYLYNGGPSFIVAAASMLKPLAPSKIGGTSYPVNVIIDDNTRFYDWKDVSTIDSSILIEENISAVFKIMLGKEFTLSMEDYFPMKRLLTERCVNGQYVYTQDGKQHVNSKVAWYGGGTNLSKLTYCGEDIKDMDMSDPIDVNITRAIIQGRHISTAHELIMTLAKCVSMATGVNSFRFITNDIVTGKPSDFDKVPQVEDLKNNFA